MLKGFSASLEMRRCRDWDHAISSLKISNYLRTCSTSFPGGHSVSLSTLNSPQGVWKVNSSGAWGSVCAEADGKCSWQVPVCS